MSMVIRASRPDDLEALYQMAKLAGPGFTNIPADRDALAAKLDRSEQAFAKAEDEPGDDCYLLILEDSTRGKAIGTAQIFSMVGQHHPFYSYRVSTMTQQSQELERTFRNEMLTLTTDYEGCSEVGGLFLHPGERAGGLGQLLARSRYLFIRQHRARFAKRVLAELRGMIDDAGGSPFWDGLAGKFFGMSFSEADEFNSTHGHQFIADLMPKHPIYTAMLPEGARFVMGHPHPSGRAAMRMLEAEGFEYEGYIDIFDGGPTMATDIENIRSIREARTAPLAAIDGAKGVASIVATGHLKSFRACLSPVAESENGLILPAAGAEALGVSIGDELTHVAR